MRASPDPRPAKERPPAQDPPAGVPVPAEPEVDPAADDPVREHTAGDEPGSEGPDPRLSVDFF